MSERAPGATRLHVAVIMDGNGRWARRRGLPRTAGHRRGARAAREVIEAAPDLNIGRLTLFAFSSDNWHRPQSEVDTLMGLLRDYVEQEVRRCLDHGVRLSFIGRRDRLDPRLREAMGAAERATARGETLHLRVAIDYSARDEMLRAAARLLADGGRPDPGDRAAFERRLATDLPAADPVPDVDLLIRTGGERRLSDFLLWECAYAELYFTPVLWPDFGAADLRAAIADFDRRERRFGALPDGESPGARLPLAAAPGDGRS